jgi:pimeloyl-ACP methyl ester carboxylesterase
VPADLVDRPHRSRAPGRGIFAAARVRLIDEVYAATLTGIGARRHLLSREIDLDTHIQDVIGVVEDEDLSDIVLVGHSYGGMVITGVADRVPEKVASLVYLDAFVPENGQSLFNGLPPDRRLTTVPGEDWLVAPPTSASFGLKRPDVIALWEGKSGPHPLATLTQAVQLTGGIGRVKQKMYILATDPARHTQSYDKVKNDPGWTVYTLPCTQRRTAAVSMGSSLTPRWGKRDSNPRISSVVAPHAGEAMRRHRACKLRCSGGSA